MISYIFYLLFTISYFLHLTSRAPELGLIHFDFILMGITLLFAMLEGNASLNVNLKTTKLLLILIAFIIFTLPFVQWPGSVIRNGLENYSKVIFFYFFTVFIINTRGRLKVFITVFLLCQMFRILEPSYLHITAGYWGDVAYANTAGGFQQKLARLSGAPHDVVNPNQLAWVIVSIIPFLYYLAWQRSGAVLKLVAVSLLPVLIYALFLTGSRSGLLSLLVVLLAMALKGGGKFRTILTVSIIFIPLIIITAERLSPELKERYVSLYDENVAGHDTAMGRVVGLKKDFSTVLNRPIFGHGLGTSKEVSANLMSGRAMIAHNLYIETLQELGAAGFIIFILFIRAVILNLMQARKILLQGRQEDPFLTGLIHAVEVWIIMDLFYSLSCFGLSSWEWYFFGGISAICVRLAMEKNPVTSGELQCSRNQGAIPA